jgi:hypothetical protein
MYHQLRTVGEKIVEMVQNDSFADLSGGDSLIFSSVSRSRSPAILCPTRISELATDSESGVANEEMTELMISGNFAFPTTCVSPNAYYEQGSWHRGFQ